MDDKGIQPIIIRRRKVVEGGHHGGAWKVAYADFVTAMMAFFLLMWLLSTTDEKTRLGLADYFSPRIPIHSTIGGGDGPFNGQSMFDQDVLAHDQTGKKADPKTLDATNSPDQSLYDIEKALLGGSGEAMEADPMLQHIRTRVTDEGLIIEVFDIDGSPLFEKKSAASYPIFGQLVGMIGRVLAGTTNPVAVAGFLARGDTGYDLPDPWVLSADRAQLTRQLLVKAGVQEARLDRVTGKADRSPVVADNPRDPRNRRIEITLLRKPRS